MDRTTASIFVAVAVLWGIPYALIAVALDHGAEPLLIAWARVAIGAVCDVAAPFTALSYGEQHVSSRSAGSWSARRPGSSDSSPSGSTRTSAGAARLARPGARVRGRRRLFGFGVGGDAASALLVLLAAFGYAVASIIRVRRRPAARPQRGLARRRGRPARTGAALSLPTGADRSALAAIVALGVLCTAAAFALYYLLIARAGATLASLTTYLAPVFAVVAGAVALSESVAPTAILGLALILAGSWLAS